MAKTELEDAGLDAENMASSTAKLREEIMALSGVDIMLDSTTFKSTYQIMEELAAKWQDLTDIQQASVTELIAGKRQGNIVSSLMTNFDIAQSALQTSLDSSGSAMEEHEKYMDSIEAKLSQLSAAWQSFAQTFMDSDFIKGGIDVLKGLVKVLESLIDNFGVLGTAGLGVLGTGIFKYFKDFKKNFKDIADVVDVVGDAVDTIDNVGDVISDVTGAVADATGEMGNLGGVVGKTTGAFKAFMKTPIGVASAIGVAVAAIALIYNQYKKAKEAAAEARQEAINASDEYLDAANSFEQAYIKYSDKTVLTVEEEADLESAIQGTINALGDKDSALQGIINSSNDYLASLEAIKKAELEAAKAAAENKIEAAKGNLKESAIGWTGFDGSEVDVRFAFQDEEAIEIAKKLGSEYVNTTSTTGYGYTVESTTLRLSPDADTDEIIKYYNFLNDYLYELENAGKENTDIYKDVNAAIETMTESMGVYIDGVYELAKANYEIDNGIPKTVEDYVKMREAILNSEDIANKSFDTRMSVANTLDSEYSKIFDLSDVEVQARKFVGLIKGYGDGTNEIGTVETFLNMRTAVNNNDCTVGQYLSELDNVTSMANTFSEKEREEFNLAFGLDTDAIKEQYNDVYNYVFRNYLNNIDTNTIGTMGSFYAQEYKNYETQRIESLLNSLTATELQAVANIKAEIDWENTSTDDILSQIKKEADLIEALNFEASIEIDTTALEMLNTVLEESASAMGLTTESIDSLKSRYSSLDSYNPSTLFEKTANGVKVNRQELEKLEKEYNDLTKSEVQEHIDNLTEAYNENAAKIDKCSNAAERAQLIAENETYKNQIEELATYQAQLEGVTGAYQDWIDAQSGSEDYEGYESVATSREDIEEEIDRGFIGNKSKAYIDLLSGEDLDGKSIDDYADAWDRLDDKVTSTGYSVMDFFTVNDDGDITATGIDRFMQSVKKDIEGIYDSDTGAYKFTKENIEAIQKEYGIGVEAIELLLESAEAAGYDVDWGGILDDIDLDTSSFETLVSCAEKMQSAYNKIDGLENVNFNFTATGIEEAESEIEKARQTFSKFINEDGTVNLKADGAEEMQFILTTLIIQKQQLSTPAIMKVDTSQIDQAGTDIVDVINKAKTLQTAYENYEIAISTGVDVEGAKKDLNAAINGMQDTSVDVRTDLKLPSDKELESAKNSIGDIKVGATLDGTAIGKMATRIQTECTPEIIAKVTGIDESAITNGEGGRQVKYTPEHSEVDAYINGLQDINKKIIFKYTTEGKKPNPSNIERTITYKYKTEGDVPEAYGTANANGTTGRAYSRGNWGIKGSGTALGGELGRELVVRDGRFFTIGDNGAEFFHYKKNDIIFNAAQTESLFKYGGIKGAKPRGTMLATGTAFADGKAFATTVRESNVVRNRITGESYGSKDLNSSDSSKDFEEVLDWIEVILDRVERSIDKFDQQANNIYKNWSSRNNALLNQISEVNKEITLQQQAKSKYMAAANGVGLSSSWVSKIQNGDFDISTIKDEALADKIKSYKDYYNKVLDCEDAIRELKETESALYKQRFDNVATEYEGVLSIIEHEKNMLEEYISQSEAQAWLVSSKYYDALASNERENISKLKEEKNALLSSFNSAMQSGTIDKYSEAWYDMVNAVDEVTLAITEGETALKEYAQAIQEIKFEQFDLLQDKISSVTEEAEFLIELLSSDKLYDDSGNFTDKGSATIGLWGMSYNTLMYQSDLVAEEIKRLQKELNSDKFDTELESRYREMISIQQEYILEAENCKNAIKDLVEEGIELELSALEEKISLYQESLDSQKD